MQTEAHYSHVRISQMATTTFSGPVNSLNGFVVGTSADPVSVTTATNINSNFATSSATTGDTRLSFNRLTISSTGSGETIRALTRVTGAGAATGGTVNGAHISTAILTGGTISGAANALRATIGASVASPGGTLAALQLDTDFASGTTLSADSAFVRVTDSGAGAGKMTRLMNIATGTGVFTAATSSSTLAGGIRVRIAGADYFLVVASAVA
jgi:hypothetical protein